MAGFEFVIENEKEFEAALNKLGKETGDFRIPFRLIASDFYRSQKIIFKLKSRGLYEPLGGRNPKEVLPNGETKRQAAERAKRRRAGIVYPLLEGDNQNLKDSTLGPGHKHSVFELGRRNLSIGTSTPYGIHHQEGTKFMHQRKFIFIDGGSGDASKSSRITGRRERWLKIIDTHIEELNKRFF